MGWNLVLEYSVGASAVAGGWSAYVVGLLKTAGIELPAAWTSVPADGGIVNLPAVLITLFLTFLLVRGVRESVTVNKVLVGVKLAAIFLFLFLAAPSVDPANWELHAVRLLGGLGWRGRHRLRVSRRGFHRDGSRRNEKSST